MKNNNSGSGGGNNKNRGAPYLSITYSKIKDFTVFISLFEYDYIVREIISKRTAAVAAAAAATAAAAVPEILFLSQLIKNTLRGDQRRRCQRTEYNNIVVSSVLNECARSSVRSQRGRDHRRAYIMVQKHRKRVPGVHFGN